MIVLSSGGYRGVQVSGKTLFQSAGYLVEYGFCLRNLLQAIFVHAHVSYNVLRSYFLNFEKFLEKEGHVRLG